MAKVGIKSINELAKKCELSYPTAWGIINGRVKNPSIETLKKIAVVVRLTVNELSKEPEPTYPATNELRRNPSAEFIFEKGDFYDSLNPAGKKLLEAVLRAIKEGNEEK